jgi:type VI secretion system protein ImpM
MLPGLFGKLPAKRDFVAVRAPAGILRPLETWMQGAVAASRTQLGSGWQDAYLRAPLWRFWLGEAICGQTVMGTLMSSMDGVGRYFPLAVFCVADDGAKLVHPGENDHAAWFAQAEDFLLGVLEDHVDYDAFLGRLDTLEPPAAAPLPAPETALSLSAGLVSARMEGEDDMAAKLRGIDDALARQAQNGRSLWWTVGGLDYSALGFGCAGFPDPFFYSRMLTGRLQSEKDPAR